MLNIFYKFKMAVREFMLETEEFKQFKSQTEQLIDITIIDWNYSKNIEVVHHLFNSLII